jgi:formamidopyrimidine-DNA glycosylase
MAQPRGPENRKGLDEEANRREPAREPRDARDIVDKSGSHAHHHAMPELPDLEYIVEGLAPKIIGRRITEISVKEPIVIRMLVPRSFGDALIGRTFGELSRHGPFLLFALDGVDLIVHHMLAGRLQIAPGGEKPVAHLCFTLFLDNDDCLRYGDDKRMGKIYVTEPGAHSTIPGYDTQGVDVLSPAFTFEAFSALIRGRRQQARVFVMDQTAMSAIGNAYADEILFAAGIHPKTPCTGLSEEERRRLYESVRAVISRGIEEVRKAGEPIEVKVRGHMKVRNRKGEPCPVCGTTIRTAGVRGYDAFFCPRCQPGPWMGKAGGTRGERSELRAGMDAEAGPRE